MLDGDLPGHVRAPVGAAGRQPGGGVAVALLLVEAALHRLQVERIVGQCESIPGADLLGARLPGVHQRHQVVDLHQGGGLHPARELHRPARVDADEGAGGHLARPCLGQAGQVGGENVVARVASVAVDILPGRAEVAGAVVAGLRGAALYRQGGEHGGGGAGRGRMFGRGLGGRRGDRDRRDRGGGGRGRPARRGARPAARAAGRRAGRRRGRRLVRTPDEREDGGQGETERRRRPL